MQQNTPKKNDASFRDPNGFVIERNGEIYRILNPEYYSTYEMFMQSGLYQTLVDEKLILEHKLDKFNGDRAVKQVKIPLITYPYEWSFDMFKDAGLATLRCQELSYKHGMELQDASAYNIQFYNGHPVMIDLTSFVETDFTQWRAYKQFCEHFLAPLALMGKKDLRLSNLLPTYIDGIPLDLASSIMPKSTFASFGINLHIHAHAKMNTKNMRLMRDRSEPQKMGMTKNLAMIDSLKNCIAGIKCNQETEWDKYYDETNYSKKAFDSKIEIVSRFINSDIPIPIIDLGANDGVFAEIASRKAFTIALDIDPNAVNNMYKKNIDGIQPLVCNLVNPSASIGWGNKERPGILQRIKEQNGSVLALALVHHLRITYGIPFDKQFELLASITKHALVEYVPRDDSQIKIMMKGRDESIYTDYYRKLFEKAISKYFKEWDYFSIKDSTRTLYEIHV